MKGMKNSTTTAGAKYLICQIVVSFSCLLLINFRRDLEQHTKCIGSQNQSQQYKELKDFLGDVFANSLDR